MSEQNMNHATMDEYKMVVFDLDGTLYFQKPFRIRMVRYLCGHLLKHPSSFFELLIVKKYRKVREVWDEIQASHPEIWKENTNLEQLQYSYVAKQMNTTKDNVEKAIRFFMHEAPLTLLRTYRDDTCARKIEELRQKGVKVVVYSDYPVEEKLKALAIDVDAQYTSMDERINALKPDPKGLSVILQDFGMDAESVLMVGDRMSKDGEAALLNGVDYLILSKNPKKRVYERNS